MYQESRVLPLTKVDIFSYNPVANTSPVAYVLVGLPGSGKSTYRETLVASLRYRKRNFSVYSTDDYLEEIALREGKDYQEVFKTRFSEAKKLAQEALDVGLSYGCDLVFDQTNLTVAKRASILKQLPHTYSRSCIYFEVPSAEQHKTMLAGRPSKPIPQSVIEQMRRSYEQPTVAEGFDALHGYWGGGVESQVAAQ